jgi:hypothetical protein
MTLEYRTKEAKRLTAKKAVFRQLFGKIPFSKAGSNVIYIKN